MTLGHVIPVMRDDRESRRNLGNGLETIGFRDSLLVNRCRKSQIDHFAFYGLVGECIDIVLSFVFIQPSDCPGHGVNGQDNNAMQDK